MRKASLAAAAVTGSLALAPVAAFAAWSSIGTGSGSVQAGTVPAVGAAPSATRVADADGVYRSLRLSWDSVSVGSSSATVHYDVLRRDANAPSADPVPVPGCVNITDTSCVDKPPLVGAATYSVVARLGDYWRAPQSPSTSIAFDNQAPRTTMTTSPGTPDGTNGWFRSAVTVGLMASDARTDPASGVSATYYEVDGETTSHVFDSATPLTLTADGTHQIDYWSVDKLNNAEAPISDLVKVDKTGPTFSTSPSAETATSAATISNITDATSGVASISYQIDSGTINAVSVDATTFTVPVSGGQSVTWRVVDKAGNTTEKKVTYATSPALSFATTYPAAGGKYETGNSGATSWAKLCSGASANICASFNGGTPLSATYTLTGTSGQNKGLSWNGSGFASGSYAIPLAKPSQGTTWTASEPDPALMLDGDYSVTFTATISGQAPISQTVSFSTAKKF